MKAQKQLSFEMFLHKFETMMIDTLVEKNAEFCRESKKEQGRFALVSLKLIKEVAFRFMDRNIFEQHMAKGLEAALGRYNVTYGYKLGEEGERKEARERLRTLLNKYKAKEYRETPLLDEFAEVVSLIAGNYGNDNFKAALLIVYDVCIRKELNHVDRS